MEYVLRNRLKKAIERDLAQKQKELSELLYKQRQLEKEIEEERKARGKEPAKK